MAPQCVYMHIFIIMLEVFINKVCLVLCNCNCVYSCYGSRNTLFLFQFLQVRAARHRPHQRRLWCKNVSLPSLSCCLAECLPVISLTADKPSSCERFPVIVVPYNSQRYAGVGSPTNRRRTHRDLFPTVGHRPRCWICTGKKKEVSWGLSACYPSDIACLRCFVFEQSKFRCGAARQDVGPHSDNPGWIGCGSCWPFDAIPWAVN